MINNSKAIFTVKSERTVMLSNDPMQLNLRDRNNCFVAVKDIQKEGKDLELV